MLRFLFSGLLLMGWLMAACAPTNLAPATDTPPPLATLPLPTPGSTPLPTPTGDVISNDPTPAPNPPSAYAPQPGDKTLTRGEAFVQDMGVLILESFPPQFQLSLVGTLPTPCHQLRVAVAPPDARNQIVVEVYTVVEPNLACIQVLAPFEVTLPLNGYPVGPTYSVVVNGAVVGEFTPQAP